MHINYYYWKLEIFIYEMKPISQDQYPSARFERLSRNGNFQIIFHDIFDIKTGLGMHTHHRPLEFSKTIVCINVPNIYIIIAAVEIMEV